MKRSTRPAESLAGIIYESLGDFPAESVDGAMACPRALIIRPFLSIAWTSLMYIHAVLVKVELSHLYGTSNPC